MFGHHHILVIVILEEVNYNPFLRSLLYLGHPKFCLLPKKLTNEKNN